MKALFQAILRTLQAGENVVICSVIAASGSTPRGTGAKMLVGMDGSVVGTIGGGAMEHAAIARAKQLHIEKTSFVKKYDLSSSEKADLGMICGGEAMVYFQFVSAGDARARSMFAYANGLWEREEDAWLVTAMQEGAHLQMGIWAEGALHFMEGLSNAPAPGHLRSSAVLIEGTPPLYVEPLVDSSHVYIFGGGHLAQALVPVIARVGFSPIVFDERERFTDIALFPGAVKTICGHFSNIGAWVSMGPRDYICIMTRGHEADYTVLEQALRTPAGYVGMIGSRSKLAYTHKKLREAGFTDVDLARIHNPIGLAIRADTPEEISISIAAELILHRAKQRQSGV